MSGNHSWWDEQLKAAPDDISRAFVMLMLFTWSEGTVLCHLSGLLDQTLSALSESVWHRLYRTLPPIMWILNKRGQRSAIKSNIETLPAAINPRLAACLLLGNRYSEKKIYDRYLAKYEGDDRNILALCQRTVFDLAVMGQMSWEKALALTKSTYSRDIATGSPALFHQRKKPMPLALARRVCAASEDYPLGVLRIAEATIAGHVRSNVRPVATVAKEDAWFED